MLRPEPFQLLTSKNKVENCSCVFRGDLKFYWLTMFSEMLFLNVLYLLNVRVSSCRICSCLHFSLCWRFSLESRWPSLMTQSVEALCFCCHITWSQRFLPTPHLKWAWMACLVFKCLIGCLSLWKLWIQSSTVCSGVHVRMNSCALMLMWMTEWSIRRN